MPVIEDLCDAGPVTFLVSLENKAGRNRTMLKLRELSIASLCLQRKVPPGTSPTEVTKVTKSVLLPSSDTAQPLFHLFPPLLPSLLPSLPLPSSPGARG